MEDMMKRPSQNSYFVKDLMKAKDVSIIFCKDYRSRNSLWNIVRANLHYLIQALKVSHDVLYVPSNVRIVGLLVVLRALRIYPKKIVRWKYAPCLASSNKLKNCFIKWYYSGFDKIFMISRTHTIQSLTNGILSKKQVRFLNYGVDIGWYEELLKHQVVERNIAESSLFITSGRENRDFDTLLKAIRGVDAHLLICTSKQHGSNDYYTRFQNVLDDKVTFEFSGEKTKNDYETLIDINKKIIGAFAVVICCKKVNYGVGFTQMLESLPLGKPILVTDNVDMPIDVEKEGIGIKVKPYDVKGWKNAMNYLLSHREEAIAMGKRARCLALKAFNAPDIAKRIIEEIAVTK